MGSMLAGSLGVPLTAILFSLEVTHCLPALLPLTLACISAYLVTALIMPRSILTEKLSRRGYHLTREYGVDPLETVIVGELMTKSEEGSPAESPEHFIYADCTSREAAELMATQGLSILPVMDRATGQITGEITLLGLLQARSKSITREQERLRLFGYVR
jgi:CIC family chloride channel protein